MRLARVKVENYRSIEDSGWVDIETDITALVGKNESGKTAFLQALFKLSNYSGRSRQPGLTFEQVAESGEHVAVVLSQS